MVLALVLSAAACGSPRPLPGPDAGAVGADAQAAGDGAYGMFAEASDSGAEVSGDGTGGGEVAPRCAGQSLGLFLCLYAPLDVGTGTEIAVEFAGTFQGMDPAGTSGRPSLGSCGAEVQRALLVEEAGGRIWRVGFGVAGGSTAELELALSGRVGTRVTGRFRGGGSFGSTSGVVLNDATGLVLALAWGGLKPEDTPSLSVEPGPVICRAERFCGLEDHKALVFRGNTSVTVAPAADARVFVAGIEYAARNILSYDWTSSPLPQCAGLSTGAGILSWAVWRKGS